jgi:putative two-component system response regulator
LQRHGFFVLTIDRVDKGLEVWSEKMIAIRLVIVELEMAPIAGEEAIKTIREQEIGETYIVTLTTETIEFQRQEFFHHLVNAWLCEPIQDDQLEALLHSVKQQLRLNDHNSLITGLTELAAARGGETRGHLQRTRRYCYLLAEDIRKHFPALGLTEQHVQDIADVSIMHDIGKIGLPDGLLTSRRFLPKEHAIIKDHTIIGGTMFEKLFQQSGSLYLLLAYEVALTHHERWDGAGYPHGLQEEEIPLIGRIMAFADAYDALLTGRPYKDPFSLYLAEREIQEERGKQFDPAVVASYERNREQFYRIHRAFLEPQTS